jgi:hypothetical protein
MPRFIILLWRRLLVLALGAFTVWLIVFVVFRIADNRLPWIVAVAATYGIAAYVILPRVVRFGLKILRHKHVPSYTVTGDGLPGDPVNLVLVGTNNQLRAAFSACGWSVADRLGVKSSLQMVRAFVTNTPYPTAPFSTLYLFGRGQDVGFQKAINDSPRKRHHIRFWALSSKSAEVSWSSARFWVHGHRPPDDEEVLWVGAGTKDVGLSFTRLTFQVTHATDSDTNAERDFIIAELNNSRVIGEVRSYQAGERVPAKQVNHYITDGEISVAILAG